MSCEVSANAAAVSLTIVGVLVAFEGGSSGVRLSDPFAALTENSPGVSLEIVELVSPAEEDMSSPVSPIAGLTVCSSIVALVAGARTDGSVASAASRARPMLASVADATETAAVVATTLPYELATITFTRNVEPTSPLSGV